MNSEGKLQLIKTVHTLVWAVFAGSIVMIPVFTLFSNLTMAWCLIGLVFLEVLVLLLNHMRCPLTDVAARYTSSRQDNFDIYLPLWVARYNKPIFGGLYLIGIIYTIMS